ncbi:MAG: SOS response-associated peptidase [Cyclobacteriaceae bacterium]|nr:SOS response-associated peptidase [Cyclobacteriaceae bacterium]
MCGRYTIIAKAEAIEKKFDVSVPDAYQPRYNAAPTQLLPVISDNNPSELSFYYWGMIPRWAKEKNVSTKLINARAESILEKASFKTALLQRRCLVVSDGFYEWKRMSKTSRVPYRIRHKNDDVFAYAGLWDEYDDEDQNRIKTFTIITTNANRIVSKIHDRMPAILDSEAGKAWLDKKQSIGALIELLRPFDPDNMEAYTVSSQVNKATADHPQMIAAAPSADQFGNLTLFD